MLVEILTLVSTAAAVAALVYTRQSNAPEKIKASEEAFKEARQTANADRAKLSDAAAGFAQDGRWGGDLRRVRPSSLLTRSSWMFDKPYPLTAVRLAPLVQEFGPPPITRLRRLIRRQLPLRHSGRYDNCAEAIKAVDPPKGAYENRVSYRLLDFTTAPAPDEPHMRLSLCRYFDMLDVGESLAMEFALSRLGRRVVRQSVGHRRNTFPIRRRLGDPTDLRRHAVLPAINTLTIRVTPQGHATFFLHFRGADDVPVAAGQTHVIPCGGFQPSAKNPLAIQEDFDLWRNISREYAEEFLGFKEALGDSADQVDYESSPYADLLKGVREGTIRPWIFGAAFDPLSYYVEVLTAVVFDSDAFDTIFPEIVDRNDEGLVLKGKEGRGIEFNEATVAQMLRDRHMAPAGAACLTLALQYREALLAKAPATLAHEPPRPAG